jgi:hypothetical protein
MTVKYSKWHWNIPSFSILRPSKINPNWDFWFENKPSGNPGVDIGPKLTLKIVCRHRCCDIGNKNYHVSIAWILDRILLISTQICDIPFPIYFATRK